MDLWYFFACIGLDILKSGGTQCFIAPNNWTSNAGASILRNKLVKESQLITYLDFGNFKVFTAGIQTMVYVLRKTDENPIYPLTYAKLLNSNAKLELLRDFLYSNVETNDFIKYEVSFVRRDFEDKFVTFLPLQLTSIVEQIQKAGNLYLKPNEITQGIVPNPDIVTGRSIEKIPSTRIQSQNIRVGDGVFVVQKGRFNNLTADEKEYFKPLYHPSDVDRYFIPDGPQDCIIYTTKNNTNGKIAKIPNILAHLKKYREIMDERRENQNGRLDFYHLHWSRDDRFFQNGPKILCVRKCAVPTFIYTEKESYVMMAFNVIKTKTISLKYLTALLNSKIIAFWLLNKGKMQGYNFQIDKEPLLEIPLKTASKEVEVQVEKLVDHIIKILASTNMRFRRQ